ncbi:CAMK family protein kinase [Histomonas meleagridis]|uniref:CAMK family protein kinase n=1 Tax=Histomonas meleagridis TaxID=135588 RepID=UPI00355A1C2E|nr:CAMK family protein kinase [Histomonas meleagridis]KAH0802661.1 CAMK family protein kinase [Histomonas meleagridis]
MQQRTSMIGNYNVIRQLGKGNQGKVMLAQHVSTGDLVAIKMMKKIWFEKNPDLLVNVQREISLMRLLQHPHLLKLIEVCESQNHLYIILEYAQGGELFDLLLHRRPLDMNLALKFFRQIIYGVEYLHSHAICHRDLKLENILLDEFGDVKIGDFGFARWMKSNIADTSCGSPHYAAPEVIRGVPYDGRIADIWSCGVILYVLLAGKHPFNDPAIRNLLAKVKIGQYVMPDFHPLIKDLISRMLQTDPQKRITIKQIKDHPAFRISIPESYIFPTPLPLPYLQDPIDVSNADPLVISMLQQIGYSDVNELYVDLTKHGHSMAKVFYNMLTSNVTVESIPWHRDDEINLLDETFMISPASFNTSVVGQQQSPDVQSLENGFSLTKPVGWANVQTKDFLFDVVQPFIDINLPLEVVLAKIQRMLNNEGFEFFHYDDMNIISRRSADFMYLAFKVKRESVEMLQVDLYFKHATQFAIQYLIDTLSTILNSED